MRFYIFLITLSLILTLHWPNPAEAGASPQPIQIKIAALNVRKSPSSKNSSNLAVGCQLKKNDPAIFATDFQFVDGQPWCKIRLPDTPGCPSDIDLWIAGGEEFITVSERPAHPIYSSPPQQSLTQAENCPTCVAQANNTTTETMASLTLAEQAIQLGPPIMMTNNCTGPACNCRGPSSGWGPRRHPQGGQRSNHRGCDIAAPRNTPVYAAADGVVKMAGWLGDFGNRIEIEHFDKSKPVESQIETENEDVIGAKDGQYISVFTCGIERQKMVESLSTSYSHLQKIAPGIKPGTVVKKGDLIGYVNSKGLSTGDHLHFEVEPIGLDCQNGRFGDTCDPQLLHGFPPQTPRGTDNFLCYSLEEEEMNIFSLLLLLATTVTFAQDVKQTEKMSTDVSKKLLQQCQLMTKKLKSDKTQKSDADKKFCDCYMKYMQQLNDEKALLLIDFLSKKITTEDFEKKITLWLNSPSKPKKNVHLLNHSKNDLGASNVD